MVLPWLVLTGEGVVVEIVKACCSLQWPARPY